MARYRPKCKETVLIVKKKQFLIQFDEQGENNYLLIFFFSGRPNFCKPPSPVTSGFVRILKTLPRGCWPDVLYGWPQTGFRITYNCVLYLINPGVFKGVTPSSNA